MNPPVFKPADPVTAAAVKAFTSSKTEAPQPATEVPEEQRPISFGAETEFDNPNQATLMSSGFVDTRLMEVTLDEKITYLKCMANEVPFELEINLFNGVFKVTLRTRTMLQQQRINDLISLEFEQQHKGAITGGEVALCAKRTNQYLLIVMVRSINGKSFGGPDLTAGTLEEAQAAALEFINAKLETMHVTRDTALTNAIRIFESKSAMCATKAADGSFWPPLS